MMNLKVGVMPGKLQEVVVENGTSARRIFEIAEISVSNHEVRLDGNVICMDDCINDGKLLVAMKQIKGNANTIKVGTMPGKLQEVEIEGTETARELFEKAGITLSNHEIRLDGNVISENDTVGEGKLLVSMKQIKGNQEVYTTNCDDDEIGYLLEQKLPRVINREDVLMCDDYVVIFNEYIISQDMFFTVYEEGYVDSVEEIETQEVKHECKCKNAVEIIENKIKEIENDLAFYDNIMDRKRSELYVLQDVLKEMK